MTRNMVLVMQYHLIRPTTNSWMIVKLNKRGEKENKLLGKWVFKLCPGHLSSQTLSWLYLLLFPLFSNGSHLSHPSRKGENNENKGSWRENS